MVRICPFSQRSRWLALPSTVNGKVLVTQADGQNRAGNSANARSRPSFRSSIISPLARAAVLTTFREMPSPFPSVDRASRALEPVGTNTY
jgi:hypothetical protein